MVGADPRDRLARELGMLDATMLVVSSVIGSGIFPHARGDRGAAAASRPDPLRPGSPAACSPLAGALANAELGAMYPRAGGDYVYLREGYHPVAGFLIGWLSFFVIYAGTVASLAAAFAEALAPHFGLGSARRPRARDRGDGRHLGDQLRRGATRRAGQQLEQLREARRRGGVRGRGGGRRRRRRADRLRPLVAGATSAAPLAAFGLALSPVLFTYLGWNAPVYVASEIRDPARTLPRSLFLGLGLCTLAYLALNVVYLYALPLDAACAPSRTQGRRLRALSSGRSPGA